MTCETCMYSTWVRTPTGRIKKGYAGHCRAPEPDLKPLVPYCFDVKPIHRNGIWPGDGVGCNAYKMTLRE